MTNNVKPDAIPPSSGMRLYEVCADDSFFHGANYIESLRAGENITIDTTDPTHPIISATGGTGPWTFRGWSWSATGLTIVGSPSHTYTWLQGVNRYSGFSAALGDGDSVVLPVDVPQAYVIRAEGLFSGEDWSPDTNPDGLGLGLQFEFFPVPDFVVSRVEQMRTESHNRCFVAVIARAGEDGVASALESGDAWGISAQSDFSGSFEDVGWPLTFNFT